MSGVRVSADVGLAKRHIYSKFQQHSALCAESAVSLETLNLQYQLNNYLKTQFNNYLRSGVVNCVNNKYWLDVQKFKSGEKKLLILIGSLVIFSIVTMIVLFTK